MSSAGKTLDLLSFFSVTRPEIGLSQLCRLAGRDKASTYRHLQALEDAGFVEQNPVTKAYRIGPVVLQLAQTREKTVPRKASAEPALARLTEVTGETTHVSVLSGSTVYSLCSCESRQYGTRIIIDTPKLPLHATSSGLCALAFGPAALFEVAAANLTVFTPDTILTRDALAEEVAKIRQSGFAMGTGSFQDDVISLGAPVYDQTGQFAGAVSVAAVATRFTPELGRRIRENLVIACREITRNWGGNVPAAIEALWEQSLLCEQDSAS